MLALRACYLYPSAALRAVLARLKPSTIPEVWERQKINPLFAIWTLAIK